MQAPGAGAHGRGRRGSALRVGRRLSLWGGVVLVLLAATVARAHPLAPALLQLVETAPGRFDVTWKVPRQQPVGSALAPALPAACRVVGEQAAAQEGTALVLRFPVDCGEAGLVGARVGVDGLASSGSNALLRVAFADGRRVQAVLHAEAPSRELAPRPQRLAVLIDYGRLGFGHILGGLDHLLFVFGLVLLAATTRQLVATVSCFTLGHSVTLSLAALGFVAFPTALVETVIAGTILALALELARPVPPGSTWMRRAPWAMAAGFGLLHGLGFAGALAEVGLPPEEIPAALLGFNLGIEVGQLLFVAAVLALRRAFAALHAAPLPDRLVRAPVYAMGGLAVYWCLDRGAALLW